MESERERESEITKIKNKQANKCLTFVDFRILIVIKNIILIDGSLVRERLVSIVVYIRYFP